MLFAFADHELDLRRRELRRAGEPIHVEPQVYDLLVHLVRNRDRVVSKDELLDTIWGGRIVSEAALSSRINAARKAVRDDGDSQNLIKTIHRRGFRFIGTVQELEGETAEAPAVISFEADQDAVPPAAMAFSGTESDSKPSIAVLPFVNLSQEPDTDYFSYGLTEDVIRLLARNRWLDVLSRHSAAAYRSQDVDPREIGAALGVRYLLQGTMLKRDDRVRIMAGLVSAETGRHLWGESYDITLADLLETQKAMAEQIAAVIEPELARLEREAAVRRPPVNLGAWDCYQRGLWHLWGFTSPGLTEAEAMFREAIGLDPGFARAHGALAYVQLHSLVQRDPDDRPDLLLEALRHGRTAVSLDDQDCMNLCVVGRILCFQHEYDEAIAYLEDAISINPSFAQAYFALGFTLIACGRSAESIAYLDRANELSPRDPHLASFHSTRALAHLSLGDLDTAVTFARRAIRVPTTNHWPFATLASLLGLMGRTDDARRAADALLSKYPAYSIAAAQSDFFFCRDQKLVDRYLEGLRLAGVPEA
ncbi:MAG: winged helix-turn-helix domain-containing tetratricopeptide repeat protein [Acetobacteraceae bacterium]